MIIEAAINGGVTPDRNPHVPRTPEDIAAEAITCLAAGASVIHTHTDQAGFSAVGMLDPSPYREAWRLVRAERPDALLHPTVAGGAPGVPMRERYAHVEALAAEGLISFGPLDAGSMNVGGTDEEGLPRDTDAIFRTTFADIRYAIETCNRLGIGMSISIFEAGNLRSIVAFEGKNRLPPGTMVKLYFSPWEGTGFGLPPTSLSLDAYLQLLAGSSLPWFVSAIRGDVVGCGLAQEAMLRGGHVVVGIEPYGGPRTPTNVELVHEAMEVARSVGRRVASTQEAAQLLGLPT